MNDEDKAESRPSSEKVKHPRKKSGNGNGNGKGKDKPPSFDVNDPTPEVAEMRLKAVVRHITHVQQSCTLLGERLIDRGERGMGHKLIANGFIHDNSKFHGIEFLYLHDDVKEIEPKMFQAALLQHIRNNPHHPEYWDGIENVPRLYMAEMVCDWHARSSEFGTDLRGFIKEIATKKFEFAVQGKVYKEIKGFVDLLLDNAFVRMT
jgi:hypothetical protein